MGFKDVWSEKGTLLMYQKVLCAFVLSIRKLDKWLNLQFKTTACI